MRVQALLYLLLPMEDEDTEVGPPPRQPDTDRGLVAAMCADTDEWDDTDRDVEAQGTLDTTPAMFEDTGVVIISKPSEPSRSDKLVVTFRAAQPTVRFRDPTPAPPMRASTQGEWPPQPRLPAIRAPQFRERAEKRAGVYSIVNRPETKN